MKLGSERKEDIERVIFSILSASLFFVQLACKRIPDEDFKIMIGRLWSKKASKF